MRLAGKQTLGYFPLPVAEAERIRRFLKFPASACSVLVHTDILLIIHNVRLSCRH